MTNKQAIKKITPQMFFDLVVPQILHDAKHGTQGGTYVIRLFGEVGGEWTINLKKGTVTRGGAKKPDVYLEMDEADFSQMMLDELDVDGAIRAGRIRYEGKLPMLAKLSEVLAKA